MDCKATLLICGLLAASVVQAAAQGAAPPAPSALLTIADGAVAVLRGRARFVAVEGLRFEPWDIVLTDAATRVVRLEFDNGTVLDLGPATQVMLQPEGVAWPNGRPATAYIAQGWAKLRAPAGGGALHSAGLASATLDLAAPDGGVVLARVERKAAFAFVESGRAQLVEHVGARGPRVFDLGEGHAYTRGDAADAGTASLRPTAAQLRETPPALADALPRRAGEWATRAAPAWGEPQKLAATDMAFWLESEPALQKALRARFVDPVRRTAVAAVPSPAQGGAANAIARTKTTKPVRVALLAPSRLTRLTRLDATAPVQSLALDRLQDPAAPAPLPNTDMPNSLASVSRIRARVGP